MAAADSTPPPRGGFLLAQVGAHAGRRFAERLAPLGITPPHAGILRLIAKTPDCSQKHVAEGLGVVPSRIVVLIDELVTKGLVARERDLSDRRNYALALTDTGVDMLKRIGKVAAEHERALFAALSEEERTTLIGLCRRIAESEGLKPGVHPGYR